MIVALCGGVGAARMLAGLVQVVDPSEITAIVNTGDDLVLHGLTICPDIDTVTYTLAGLDNRETGWGVATETWTVMAELKRLGGASWFRLGDRDLATHLYRSERLREGSSLGVVTGEIAGARGVGVTILPMSDDPVRTRVTLAGEGGEGGEGGEDGEVGFQDYFVRLRHDVAVSAIRFEGAEFARAGPGVLEAIREADRIVVCPSNPIVSIGPILAVPGIVDALVARRDRVVAVSPIIGGAALKGPADRLLRELGHECSSVGVATMVAPWAGTLVVDSVDAGLRGRIEDAGLRCVVAETVMTSPEVAASLARVVLDAAG